MKNLSSQNILFVFISLLFLGLGIFGVSRQSFRAGKPFAWEERAGQIILTEVYPGKTTQKTGLANGDILLQIDDHPLKTGKEIDLLLDTRKSGQRVSFTVQRMEREFTVSLDLVQRYSNQFIVLNSLLGILFWIVGVFVVLNKPAERAALIAFWASMTISTSLMLFWEGFPYDAKIIGHLHPILYYIIYPSVPTLILYFTALYPTEKHFLKRYPFFRLIFFAPSLCFIILLETFHLRTIFQHSLENHLICRRIYTGFQAYFIFTLLISIGFLIHSYKHTTTRESRNKIQWILWGICFGTAPFLFLWSLPLVLG
ncbi:MAG: PDZ domain-containing protein, partial [bacterium]